MIRLPGAHLPLWQRAALLLAVAVDLAFIAGLLYGTAWLLALLWREVTRV